MKKQKLFSLLIAGICALTCIAVGTGILNTETASAAYTNEGGVDHYTDMTSNGEDLEYYDTLYNEDWDIYNGSNALEGNLSSTWNITNDKTLRFTPSESNTTGSFVWKFTYTCTTASTGMYIYPLSSGSWNGATQIDFGSCGFTAGNTYEVELGVVKVKNNDNYYVFVTVDGAFKLGTYRAESAKKGNDLYFYITGGAGTAVSNKPAVVYEYEEYQVIQNDDLGLTATYTAPSADATKDVGFTNDLGTASFVYKFNYTPASANNTNMYLRSSYWGQWMFTFRQTDFHYGFAGSTPNASGEVFTVGNTHLVELGVIDIKDSDNTWVFVKVDGVEVVSTITATTQTAKNISFYGNTESTLSQYSYDVNFNGEIKEVLVGQAIGALPEASANENEFLGWFDQDGNEVTAETVVTKDLTVTAIFAEPHNVIFTVDGEVYETYENVAYNTAIGELPVAPKKAGYDFVKWSYGGEEVTAETIVSTHMTVVAEYAERGYYLDEELEDYVVVQNDDLGLAAIYNVPSADATSGVGFTNELATASFVYKFQFTPANGDAIVYVRSSYWGGNSNLNCFFRGTQILYQIGGVDNIVNDVFTIGETHTVELGAIDIKDSDTTWVFVKVNGNIVFSKAVSTADQVKGVSFYGSSAAVFAQYSYDVNFNGEIKEVLVGQAIGALPEAPANENEFLGWFDQDGNEVTAETVVTKDLTVTAIFAEPHNVIFTVDGEVYETYENIAYNTAIGELPVAPKKAGYDFVKWTYGGKEVTAETIVSTHMTVIAEYVERGYYIDEELEAYVVVQNDDLGLAAIYNVPSADATSDVGFTNELATASFVYKFEFTPAESNDAIVYVRADYWGGQSKLNCFFRGTQIIYQINGVDNTVNDLFVMGETSVVELGAIDIKDSDNTWIFVKVNGNIVLSQTVSAEVAAQTKGLSFYGTSTAVFAQYSWTVDFNGEKKEVVNGTAIGELPVAPESEYEFIGWADQQGNILTAETVITENLTVNPVFNEPHTVTFVVNGETVATVDNVGYQETVTLPECNVPGYNFVKWVYGDNLDFTAETQVVSNLTVTAVLEVRDFTEEELADYVTVTNKDIGAATSIKNTNSSFANYEIATENETSSVVYKFVYARGEKSLYICLRDIKDGWGANADGSADSGYVFILNGSRLETCVSEVVEAFPTENGLYLVEIGVIDVKNSNEVFVYVKVNGEIVASGRTLQPTSVGNYIGMWGDDTATSTINEWKDYHFLEGVIEKHTIEEVQTLEPSCTEEGYTAYSYCSVCQADIVAKEIIGALGHTEEKVDGCAATCTETGLTDGSVCTVCGETTVEQTVIDELGHDLHEVEAVAPGCETVGATAGERCIREGCEMIVSGCEEVAAKGHTAVVDEAVASTCIERGKTEGSHCDECDKILQAQESLPLAEHNYVDGVCSVCGDEELSIVEPEDSSSNSSNDSGATSSTDSSSTVLSGCFGSIGGSIGGIVAVIGVSAICLKKKKEE